MAERQPRARRSLFSPKPPSLCVRKRFRGAIAARAQPGGGGEVMGRGAALCPTSGFSFLSV